MAALISSSVTSATGTLSSSARSLSSFYFLTEALSMSSCEKELKFGISGSTSLTLGGDFRTTGIGLIGAFSVGSLTDVCSSTFSSFIAG